MGSFVKQNKGWDKANSERRGYVFWGGAKISFETKPCDKVKILAKFEQESFKALNRL